MCFCSHSCSIEVPSGDKVIITGGFLADTIERVQMYTALGATERLPDLQQPRYNHGCGSFVNNNKETVSTTKYSTYSTNEYSNMIFNIFIFMLSSV